MEEKELEAACAVVRLYGGESGEYVEGDPPNEVYVFPLMEGERASIADRIDGYQHWQVSVDRRNFPGGSVSVLIVRSDALDDALALFALWLVAGDPTSKVPKLQEGTKVLPCDDEEEKTLRQAVVRVGKALLALPKYR